MTSSLSVDMVILCYLASKVQKTYPEFGELVGISVEWDEYLIAELVREVLPEHLHVLRLYVEEVVAGPAALVSLGYRLHQGFRGSLDSWKIKQCPCKFYGLL